MKAIYPGSFDPVTNGHLDIILRAANKFDELVVAVLINKEKESLFSIEERFEMLENLLYDYSNISVKTFDGLLVDFFKKEEADVVIRGLRAVSDYEYELKMAHTNKVLLNDFETVFMVASACNSFLSSTTVKEVIKFNGDISNFVPPYIQKKIKEKLGGKNGYNSID